MTVRSFGWFTLGAALEIAGCFGFWKWLRGGGSLGAAALGALSLVAFAATLTRVDVETAGRTFAAYGGIYIAASLIWMHVVEGSRPGLWDFAGAALSIAGAVVILANAR